MALLLPFDGKKPTIAAGAFLAPNAVLIGDVTVEAEASIWFGAVLRGDDPANGIHIGARSSIQDNVVIHVGNWGPTLVGEGVTVGHGAVMESCSIGDGSLIGMNAVVLQNARLGRECLVAAGCIVLEGMEVPDRSVVAGVPGRVRKTLEGGAAGWVSRSAAHYVALSRKYLHQELDRGAEQSAGFRQCDRCGGPMLDRHCKLICTTCGYQRDCSDP